MTLSVLHEDSLVQNKILSRECSAALPGFKLANPVLERHKTSYCIEQQLIQIIFHFTILSFCGQSNHKG